MHHIVDASWFTFDVCNLALLLVVTCLDKLVVILLERLLSLWIITCRVWLSYGNGGYEINVTMFTDGLPPLWGYSVPIRTAAFMLIFLFAVSTKTIILTRPFTGVPLQTSEYAEEIKLSTFSLTCGHHDCFDQNKTQGLLTNVTPCLRSYDSSSQWRLLCITATKIAFVAGMLLDRRTIEFIYAFRILKYCDRDLAFVTVDHGV